jgi:hypothetical protein
MAMPLCANVPTARLREFRAARNSNRRPRFHNLFVLQELLTAQIPINAVTLVSIVLATDVRHSVRWIVGLGFAILARSAQIITAAFRPVPLIVVTAERAPQEINVVTTEQAA